MFLCTYTREVFALECEMSATAMANYAYVVKALTRFVGAPILLMAIDEPLLNRFILWRLASGKSAASVRNERFALLRIADHAAERGYRQPINRKRVRSVTLARSMPRGPHREHLLRLLVAASGLHGQLSNGAARAIYFQALLSAAYETGLRKGDLFRLRRDQIDSDGVIILTISKTQATHVCRISPATMGWLDALPGDTPLRFPHSSPSTFSRWCGRIKASAGVPIRGLLQPVRRSAASYVNRDGGNAQEFLGHATPGIAERYYLVPEITRQGLPPMPPELAALTSRASPSNSSARDSGQDSGSASE